MTPVPRITCEICPGLLPPFFHPRIKLRGRNAHGGGRRPGNEAAESCVTKRIKEFQLNVVVSILLCVRIKEFQLNVVSRGRVHPPILDPLHVYRNIQSRA